MAQRGIEISSNKVATIELLHLEDGTQQIVKRFNEPYFLEAEVTMLEHLAPHITVPAILKKEGNELHLEYFENDASCHSVCEEQIADALASLHSVMAEGVFGFGSDTSIGIFKQRNRTRIRWVDFYREMRLLDFSKKAYDEGVLDAAMRQRIEKLSANLEQFLTEPEHSSLLHGDLWRGNVLTRENQCVAFIDPACYYGHYEMELAFIGMFNTFGESFYARYAEHRAIEAGFFEERAHLYRLYPYLVHLRAYGAEYLKGIDDILTRVGY